MRDLTRKLFHVLCSRLAAGYGVADVSQQFSVTPSVQQLLKDKIVEASTFLPRINIITVDELKGENILAGASGPVTGRTDTTGDAERTPRDVLGLDKYTYELAATQSDVYMRYNTVDAWAKFKDMAERYLRYVQARIATDMELIGWHGVSVAATTNLAVNTMLQDVNKGWLQYMRENKPANVLTQGEVAGKIRFGAGGDFVNLDVAVHDLMQGIPSYMRQDLVALIGTDLIAQEKAALMAAVGGKPTEKALAQLSLTTFGGLPWETPSNFPARGMVITSLDNLSIYQQDGSWRRQIVDNPKKDRVEDYNSRNEGYVVETPEKLVAWEFANVKLEGEW
ncbi:phage major capsid protein, P2 family [Desulfovibrio falkowii]|uniref:Phage major capsid protein, P2 family n=1 Tax=Desulfovibrio falkowii TaxID=3136602 RepID=A0ABQ0EAG3_9BACT